MDAFLIGFWRWVVIGFVGVHKKTFTPTYELYFYVFKVNKGDKDENQKTIIGC